MPQHMGDLILPWPFGHTEIATDVPSSLTRTSSTRAASCAQTSAPSVARSASARLQLVGHLGLVHRQEARAVGRPRQGAGTREGEGKKE